ncbi:MAG: calcium/proton exchanger [Xenococcaceae cyanobacterium]
MTNKAKKKNTKAISLLFLLIFVPLSLISDWLELPPAILFITSGLAIIPLATCIANTTEEISFFIGATFGGLLNATFGNVTEMIISIVALQAGLVDVVKASLTGSIIANLLLALGLAILLGGLRFREQNFQATIARRLNASSLTLAVIVMLTPAAIRATSDAVQISTLNHFSYAVALLLLTFYGLTLWFSVKNKKEISQVEYIHNYPIKLNAYKTILWKKIGLLLLLTLVLFFVSGALVDSLRSAIASWGLTEQFTGVIIIPLFGGIVEYIACVTFALRDKMELAVSVALGSSLQIALFVVPILVLLGGIMGQPMNLAFNAFEVVAVAMAVVITNSINTAGSSNWLEGVLLLITYAVLGTAFYFHPS